MRATPSRTSSTVPTSLTSSVARSAEAISRSRMSFSSPGRRMDSVAMRVFELALRYAANLACENNHNARLGKHADRWAGGRRHGKASHPERSEGPYTLLLVFPLTNAASTPRGPKLPNPLLGTLAIRRAVLARWLGDAKWRTRTTVGTE